MGQHSANSRDLPAICVGIPAYSRSSELVELFESIYAQTVLPTEIAICEDDSPERKLIREIVGSWRQRFADRSCEINYHENDVNLGYDGNVRRVIGISRSPWVMLMGNDDLLLPECIDVARRFLGANPQIRMASRAFVMFKRDVRSPFATSRYSSTDQVFRAREASAAMIFRACGFVGGLLVNQQWASNLATDRYDGSLYYQIYLGAEAFCEGGIGYICKPIVGSRSGNPPLFGSSASENDVHIPGSYTAKGRAKMWESVLRIADDVGRQHGFDLVPEIKRELEVRQSFHIFEMMAGAGRGRLTELRREFEKIGLFSHPLPRSLYLIDAALGSKARLFFLAVRKFKALAGKIRGFFAKEKDRSSLGVQTGA